MSWSEKGANMPPKMGESNTDARNKEIWRKKKGGMSHSQLAKMYGVSRQRINSICRREEREEFNGRIV
jgi:Mor family transcriptional regulator